MASDNLLAGLEGLFQGISGTAVPIIQNSIKMRQQGALQAQNDERDLQNKIRFLPYQTQAQTSLLQSEQPFKLEQIMASQQPTTVLGRTGNEIGNYPGRVGFLPSSPEDKLSGMREPGINTLIGKRATELDNLFGEATKQKTALPQIRKLKNLVETEGVTGKAGQAKAFFAPYAEALGFTPESFSKAQTFQLMSRLLSGPLRTEIVGSGQVSNYEQELLSKLSGGGEAGKQAALELFNYYESVGKRKVDDYNSMRSNSISLSPRFGEMYTPIDIQEEKQPKTGGGNRPPLSSFYRGK